MTDRPDLTLLIGRARRLAKALSSSAHRFPRSLPYRLSELRPCAVSIPTLGRPPLPLTSLVLALLVLLPALQLWRLPRPRAAGLEQLLGEASLLQSFPPTPDRPVPSLWRERLGAAQAAALWRRQRGPWWQFWGEHADAAPLLAFSASSLPGGATGALPPNGLRVGDLVVVAADPLSRQLLLDRLLPQQRLSRGLNRRCLERLRQDQAVLWNSTGLGGITGPVSPLLQRLSRGCLSVALAGRGLIWHGEAGDAEGLLLPLESTETPTGDALLPLPPDRLLELEGGSTDLLLAGLLSRPLIRDPLSSRYGLDASRLELLRRTPFRLRLKPLAEGPFLASLELQLPVGRQKKPWQALLEQLHRALVEQGLSPAAASQARLQGSSLTAPQATADSPEVATQASIDRDGAPSVNGATWTRSDGVIVGGWRWINQTQREPEILFFLGPVPTSPQRSINQQGGRLPGPGGLRLRLRPDALQRLGLLPDDLPTLVQRADQLWMEASPASAADATAPLSRLWGGLRVPR